MPPPDEIPPPPEDANIAFMELDPATRERLHAEGGVPESEGGGHASVGGSECSDSDRSDSDYITAQ